MWGMYGPYPNRLLVKSAGFAKCCLDQSIGSVYMPEFRFGSGAEIKQLTGRSSAFEREAELKLTSNSAEIGSAFGHKRKFLSGGKLAKFAPVASL